MVGEVLTVEEAARALKVTETTVRRWCLSGRLSAFKIGRAWRIPASSIERFFQQAGRGAYSQPGANGSEGPGGLWSRMTVGYLNQEGKEGGGGKSE